MNISTWILGIILILFLIAESYTLWRIITKPGKVTTYRIKVKFAHGITTRLTLNQQQYEEFKAWENQSEGNYYIGVQDESHVILNRSNVCAIEVKKR